MDERYQNGRDRAERGLTPKLARVQNGIAFDHQEYMRSHGKAPSGSGFWMFRDEKGQEHQCRGTLTECKRLLAAKGVSGRVMVLP